MVTACTCVILFTKYCIGEICEYHVLRFKEGSAITFHIFEYFFIYAFLTI